MKSEINDIEKIEMISFRVTIHDHRARGIYRGYFASSMGQVIGLVREGAFKDEEQDLQALFRAGMSPAAAMDVVEAIAAAVKAAGAAEPVVLDDYFSARFLSAKRKP